jgi:hypothetical protein
LSNDYLDDLFLLPRALFSYLCCFLCVSVIAVVYSVVTLQHVVDVPKCYRIPTNHMKFLRNSLFHKNFEGNLTLDQTSLKTSFVPISLLIPLFFRTFHF